MERGWSDRPIEEVRKQRKQRQDWSAQFGRQINTRIGNDLLREIDQICEAENCSRAVVAELLMQEGLTAYRARKAKEEAERAAVVAKVEADRLELERLRNVVALLDVDPSSKDLNVALGIVKCNHCGRTTDGAAICWRCAADEEREGS